MKGKTKTMKAGKPHIRTKTKRSRADTKDRAHSPVIAGRPINRKS